MEKPKRILAAVEHYNCGKFKETRYMPDVVNKGMSWQISLDGVASLVRDQGYNFINYSQERVMSFEREEGIVFLIRSLRREELKKLAEASSRRINL